MKHVKKLLSLLCALALAVTTISGAVPAASALVADPDNYTAEEAFAEGYDISTRLGAEGSVLLKNSGLLPLAQGTKVTLLGAMSYNYVLGGTGSAGGKDDENTVSELAAFTEAGLDVNAAAWEKIEALCGGSRGVKASDPDEVGWTEYTRIHEFDIGSYENIRGELTADGYTDIAIVTLARSGAEGASPSMDYDGDGSTLTGSTYLEPDEDEKALLAFCAENYAHTIVLVNSAVPMEMGFIDSAEYNIDACLWIGHPGEAGMVGVGQILTGLANPSGRLVDTWSYDMSTNPTYYNTDDNKYANVEQVDAGWGIVTQQAFYQYEEGIYMGYRYYETADAVGYFDSDDFAAISFKNGSVKGYEQVVQFPFGYGLSYTTFTEEIVSSDISLSAHGSNSITVKVTNTGDVAGKNVVELYMDAPYQTDTDRFGIRGVGLEKAKVVLIGFDKTDILQPGESQELTITFETDDLASFDNFGQGCYVLENGTYTFNVQKDAHQWGERASASVTAELADAIIYNEDGAGARASDKTVARNAMDDVTAGDGLMLDGYLSRSDIAGGMKQIMQHESSETPNELANDRLVEILQLEDDETAEYIYTTYNGGEKVEKTATYYAHGNNSMTFAETLPDGTAAEDLPDPLWEQTYYVLEGQISAAGYPVVVDEEPASGAYHKLVAADLAGVDIYTEEGFELFEKLTNETTIDEAIEIQGNSGWNVSAVDSVEKKQENCVDGPGEAKNGSNPGNTWWPCAVVIASTWNTDLAAQEGVAYGHQAVLSNVQCAYAPAMNTHRSPFGGRNFEYYSEDGLIGGKIGGAAAAGIMSTGTNVFIKHCALNDGDTNRNGNTCWANEQAIREIYMVPYEISIKEYNVNGVMGSLNRIGMSWFHYGMYQTMMRDEWGWEGNLITDGDAASGDAYNTPVALVVSEGSVLNRGVYLNARSTEAAYGDSTEYVLGRYKLHNVMRHCLYQYCSTLANSPAMEGNLVFAPSSGGPGGGDWTVAPSAVSFALDAENFAFSIGSTAFYQTIASPAETSDEGSQYTYILADGDDGAPFESDMRLQLLPDGTARLTVEAAGPVNAADITGSWTEENGTVNIVW